MLVAARPKIQPALLLRKALVVYRASHLHGHAGDVFHDCRSGIQHRLHGPDTEATGRVYRALEELIRFFDRAG